MQILRKEVRGTFINHWDRAIEIHQANHPEHRHLEEDLFMLDPESVFPPETYCSLLWGSPSCQFFSIARGASCVNEQGRSHAHSVTDWVRHLNPEGVIIENVREFLAWGPVIQKRQPDFVQRDRKKVPNPHAGELMWCKGAKPVRAFPEEHLRRRYKNGRRESEKRWSQRMLKAGYDPYEVPDKQRAGEYFQAWITEMKGLGYEADWRLLRSCDYGDPTIRLRLFVYFVRKDSGKRIVWPNPTHARRGTVSSPDEFGYWRRAWPTAFQCIDWSLKGSSVFTRKKPLADNTFRRLAIGTVKFALKKYLSAGEAEDGFLTPNFGERPTQAPRTHSLEDPMPTATSHGAGGLAEPQAEEVDGDTFMIPKDKGHRGDYVRGTDHPVGGITTRPAEGLVEPQIVRFPEVRSSGQEVGPVVPEVAGGSQEGVSTPMIDHIRGTGVVRAPDEPLPAPTAQGGHQALAEAFMMAIDQTGGGRNHGCYSGKEPVRTIVTKANASCIEVDLEEVSGKFLECCKTKGVDASRAVTFLGYLVAELKRKGRADARPWIYVYYSNGPEGKAIDEPMPANRTKESHALVYPVIELHGRLLKIDLLYRMLTPLELQRAMGFPDDMNWAGATKTEIVRAIGNSVSRGVARALGLAWYSQSSDIAQFLYPDDRRGCIHQNQ